MTVRPDEQKPQLELEIKYKFIAGTMPPPDHDEYEIVVTQGGGGRIAYWPDYPSFDPPCWEYLFPVAADQLKELVDLIESIDIFEREWEIEDERRVGGSLRYLTVTLGDRTVDVPSRLENRELVSPIYQAVRGLVPQNIWEEIETMAKEFIENYEEKQQ
jgi:hypothetical protein